MLSLGPQESGPQVVRRELLERTACERKGSLAAAADTKSSSFHCIDECHEMDLKLEEDNVLSLILEESGLQVVRRELLEHMPCEHEGLHTKDSSL